MTAPPAAVDGHTAPPDPAAEAVIPAMPPIATGKRILTGSKTPGKTLQSRLKRGENRPSCKRRDSRHRFRNHRRLRGNRPQHPPGFLVWPGVLAPPPANGQESQVITRLTASGHASDSGERATASGHADLPSGQGKTRTLMARPGVVNRPPPVTPQAVTVCPVSIQGSRPVTARPRAPMPRAVSVRRPRPHPARAGTRREPSRRQPESTLSTS